MQWNKIKNGQIHIYEMEEKTGVPLQLAYCNDRLFCKNEELEVLAEGDTLYWRHGAQKGRPCLISSASPRAFFSLMSIITISEAVPLVASV